MSSQADQPVPAPLSRRTLLRGGLALGAALPAAGLLGACGGGDSGSGAPAPTAQPRPSYYPSSYDEIVAGSKKENQLTIYSNMDDVNWQPIIKAFQAQYPWISKVSTNNLGSSEVFSKFYAESAGGAKSQAGMLVSGDPTSWDGFASKNLTLAYASPEKGHVPSFSEPEGLHTFSADPILMGYNKTLIDKDKYPTGIKSLADLATADATKFKDKISTYSVTNTFGFAVEHTWATKTGSTGWDTLNKLLPITRPEDSSGPIVEKLTSGEYLAGYFLSSTVILPAADKSPDLIGWSYIDDGTPIFLRGMAIPKTTPQPNCSKLMLDFILSHAGQIAVYQGGFTPYRSDVTDAEAPRNLNAIKKQLGADKVLTITYDAVAAAETKAFTAKWQSAMGR